MKQKILRIRIHKVYLGSIDLDFVQEFKKESNVNNFTNWIKATAWLQHGFLLDTTENVQNFALFLEKNYYSTPAEWIKECMRKELFSNKAEEQA